MLVVEAELTHDPCGSGSRKTQEVWWCDSTQVQKPENQGSPGRNPRPRWGGRSALPSLLTRTGTRPHRHTQKECLIWAPRDQSS